MTKATEQAQILVRQMARALGRNGLSGPFGHCSVRIDAEHFLVCAPRPMALIGRNDEGMVIDVAEPLPEKALGEVRIHQEVYRRKPHVNAVCRFISPHITALAALGRTPLPRHGFGAYFSPEVPFWRQPDLVRDLESAQQVAALLGDGPAIVLSVNGAVTVGGTAARALSLAWFLEDSARVELAVLSAGDGLRNSPMTPDEAGRRATWDGRIAERMWEYMTRQDEEDQRAAI